MSQVNGSPWQKDGRAAYRAGLHGGDKNLARSDRRDVLFLLDCCYSTTAPIEPGKEPNAACEISRTTTPRPSFRSLATGVVEEPNRVFRTQHISHRSALVLLQDRERKGRLEYTPFRAEAMVGLQPAPWPDVLTDGSQLRSSICLAPLGTPAKETSRCTHAGFGGSPKGP